MKGMFALQALQRENIVTQVNILPTLQANPLLHQHAILVLQEAIALGMEDKHLAVMAITLQAMHLSAHLLMLVNLRQAAGLHSQTQLLTSGPLSVIPKKETAQEEKSAMEVLVKQHVLAVVIVKKVPLLKQAQE